MKSVHSHFEKYTLVHVEDEVRLHVDYRWEGLVWEEIWAPIYDQIRLQVWDETKKQVRHEISS
jgi:hypothetical protein